MTSKSKATQPEGGKCDRFDEPVEKLRKLCDDKDIKEKVTGELQNMEEKYTLLTENKHAEEMKMFNDSIHGPIELCLLLVKIIDTPQFQRLRHIKQLGAGYWVYPGAPHNRFEHSIGVAYLAGCLVSSLQEKQPELKITNRDKLCVQIAGLCHDLGHGPFSHLFDNMFIPEARPEKSEWKHEQGSVDMFNHMVKKNGLKKIMKAHGLEPDEDIQFITELIKGVHTSEEETTPEGVKTLKKWTATGRTEEKSFLYEILANKRNGIDVDKWDYFARDCHHLGISKSFDHQRLLKLTRVCDVEIVKGSKVMRKLICFRDKEKDNIYGMFCTRYNLHRQAYQHKTVNIIEIMIKDALLKADTHFKFSTMIDDMPKYTGLTDNVFEKILYPDFDLQTLPENTRGELQEAQKILEDISNRRLPKLVMEARLSDGKKITPKILKKNWKEAVEEWNKTPETRGTPLNPDEFVLDLVKMDHGMKGKDLTENVYYFSKRDPKNANKIPKDQMTSILPDKFYEDLVRIYHKGSEGILETAKKCVEQWCEKDFGLPKPKIHIFEEENFGGKTAEATEDCPSVQNQFDMKDVLSCKVERGIWMLCEGPDSEDGFTATMPEYNRPQWNFTVKSLKCLKK